MINNTTIKFIQYFKIIYGKIISVKNWKKMSEDNAIKIKVNKIKLETKAKHTPKHNPKPNNNPESHNQKKKLRLPLNLDKQKISYPICVVVSVILIIIVAVIVTSLNKKSITDDYFVSDDTKSVINMSPNSSKAENSSSVQTHIVYTFDGDVVNGLKTYFEYPSAEAAKAAYEKNKSQPEFANSELNNKYIVVTADVSQFQGLTASDVKQQAEAIERLQNTNKPPETQSEETPESQPEEPQE